MMVEIWKDIPEYEGLYQISNLGRVKSLERFVKSRPGVSFLKPEKILKHNSKPPSGYPNLNLCKNAKIQNVCIHRLIAELFIPNPENKRCINHKDGNKDNFQISNLEWVTHSENTIHAFAMGLQKQSHVFGTGHGMSKMNGLYVQVIRETYASNMGSHKSIAEYFKVAQATIRNIIIRKTWSHI